MEPYESRSILHFNTYYLNLGEREAWWRYFQGAIDYREKAFSIDSNSIDILSAFGNWYMVLG